MIQVLCGDLTSLDDADCHILFSRASPERQQRARRYRRREDALRCVAADALLSHVLGTRDYTVEKSPLGKPRIRGREDFHYNLSHSGPWVVLAWGNAPVGVDVEQIRMDEGKASIALRFFAPEEQAYVFEKPEETARRFFQVWTGKESYLKYLGTGLRRDLTSFSVLSLPPQLHLLHQVLPGDYSLTVCTCEECCPVRTVDLRSLLKMIEKTIL